MGEPAVVPSVRDELERKAFEHIELLAIQVEQGKISAAQFDTGVRAVWACVSGLVSKWLVDTISEIKDTSDSSWVDYRILKKGFTVVVLRRRFGDSAVYMQPLTGNATMKGWDFSEEQIPAQAAMQHQDKVQSELFKAGYELIGGK